MKAWIDERVGAARVWMRERKERAAEKRAAAIHHGAPLVWVWFLAVIAASTLLGSTWMLIVFIAGSVGNVDWAIDWRAGNDGEPARWLWFAEARVHAIIGGGLFLFCLGIAAFNAVWLHIRHYLHGLFRNVVTIIGVFVMLFMISGAIVTQQWGTDARIRDQVTATNTAQAGVAAISAEIAAIEREMERLCAPALTTYQAQACRSGEQAWQGRISIARQQSDYQLGGIERAIVDAQQGDRWRARLLELRQQAAVASVETVEAEAAAVVSTGWMAIFARVLEDIRKPFIAVLGELLAMTMFGVALAAWRSRQPYKVPDNASGWADRDHQIEDKRDEASVPSQPYEMQTVLREEDPESGEVRIKITPKPHWRTLKKGKKEKVEVAPDFPADEVGVSHDGGGRMASVASGVVEGVEQNPPMPSDGVDDQPDQHDRDGGNGNADESKQADDEPVHPEPSEITLSDEETLALETLADEGEQDQQAVELPDGEGTVIIAQEEPEAEREPETRADRLIAAE